MEVHDVGTLLRVPRSEDAAETTMRGGREGKIPCRANVNITHGIQLNGQPNENVSKEFYTRVELWVLWIWLIVAP